MSNDSPGRQDVTTLAGTPVAVLADLLGARHVMDIELQAVIEAPDMLGPAATARVAPGSKWGSFLVLDGFEPGSVIVVDAGGRTDRAVWGGLTSLAASLGGAAGVVVDGAIRDVVDTRSLGLPVYSRAVTPLGPGDDVPDQVDVTVECGGVEVAPGDLVRGDADGVVVVPRSRVEEAARWCRRILRREEKIEERLKSGASLMEAMDEVRENQSDGG